MSRPSAPASNLTKPSPETLFHIDYEWWERSGQDLRLYMVGHLCERHREEFAAHSDEHETVVDWVDPLTAQVRRVDRLNYVLLDHCSRQPDYITERTSLVDAVFRTLLAAGNRPMTPIELAERTGRPANKILRTLSGRTIYKGLRPLLEG
ncbi:MAG: hypothetical protein JXB30_13840 [Anaerolineae bacterium]|nr:hypothetical protein [Anaerolineae bacterium]